MIDHLVRVRVRAGVRVMVRVMVMVRVRLRLRLRLRVRLRVRVRVGVRVRGRVRVRVRWPRHLHDPPVVLAVQLMVDHPRGELVPFVSLHAEDREAILAVLILGLLLVRLGLRPWVRVRARARGRVSS